MYVCLHVTPTAGGASRRNELLHLALQFAPAVEQTSDDTVVFSITPLERLFGTPHALASEIGRYGYEQNLNANLAIAANPDTAVLLAKYFKGVTFASEGTESERLGSFVLLDFYRHGLPVDPALLDLLDRWGVKTCADLGALPEKGVAERFGPAGVYLRNLAMGRVHRPLRITAKTTKYEEKISIEEPVDNLEPLLFLFGRVLNDLCERLRSQSRAARQLHIQMSLSDVVSETEARPLNPPREFVTRIEFPVPLDEPRSILKILQLHLERHSPPAPVNAFLLRIDPVDPRRLQSGLFLPPTPAPDKLQITIARIAGLVGESNVGSPEILNTHRPDAFALRPLVVKEPSKETLSSSLPSLKLSMRIFRPALYARVRVEQSNPKEVIASSVKGRVVEFSGPWRTTGDWWTESPWARDEWDVELTDGALYRIYCELKSKDWYVQAVYD